MLKRCIRAENRKLHTSPIWLLFLIPSIICKILKFLRTAGTACGRSTRCFIRCYFSLRWCPHMRPTCGG